MKFLVVDALAGVQSFARQLLQGQGHAAEAILCCADPEAALAQGLDFKPDLLITDWFPKASLSGPALFQRLRQDQPRLRLALLSFELTPEHEAQARALDALFLLKKPFTAEHFQAQMGQALAALGASAKGSPAQPQRRGGLRPAAPRPALPAIALLPALKPGDRVRYKGELLTVQYVVHRQGQTALQFKGKPDLIPEDKVERVGGA